ncbi:neuropeptide FF receptor 1 [Clonorchis sinensis]|uniref:Neuropeptide FF receptor 1 n=1 Tax=Clonorchis sinensis TaxID=79923 RepID=G7YVR0_CLOSI|nr:neuropeptide FF receptor 1 [Clonorchis sinensis]
MVSKGNLPAELKRVHSLIWRAFALDVIQQTHEQWKSLISGKSDGKKIACCNVLIEESPFIVSSEDFAAELLKCPDFTEGKPACDPACIPDESPRAPDREE